ncbi:MAG: fused MFS/spermidine synthase [Gammaproteobacteria bacterium]
MKLPKHSLLIFMTGAVILGLELAASRYMAPMFGSSLYIWGAILSITLLCLSAGYSLGGRLGVRLAAPVNRLILFALIAATWIGVLPLTQAPIADLGLAAGHRFGPLLVTVLLFALPILLLATATPLVFAANNRGDHGESAPAVMGDLFAISTVGSVVGALVTAYGLIPTLGIRHTLFTLSAILFITISPHLVKGLYLRSAANAILVVALLQFFYEPDPDRGLNPEFKRIYRASSEYSQVSVLEHVSNQSRVLLLNGTSHNWVDGQDRSQSLFNHVRVLQHHVASHPGSKGDALVLGLGAGILPKHLKATGFNVEVVEIDPLVVSAARKYFEFSGDIPVHVEDARTFINAQVNAGREYSLIIVDVAGGGSQPGHVFNLEAFSTMQRLLAKDGLLISNQLATRGNGNDEYIRSILATLKVSFPHVHAVDVYPEEAADSLTNFLVFASTLSTGDAVNLSAYGEAVYNPETSDMRPIDDNWNPTESWAVSFNELWHNNMAAWLGPGANLPM